MTLLVACQSSETKINDKSRVLVKVGDMNITEKYMQAYFVNLGVLQPSKEQFDQALDTVVKQQSLVYQAEKEGLQLNVEQQLSILQLKNQALAQLVLQKYLAENPIDEAAIKAEYDGIINELKGEEYKVHHMLFKDELSAILVLDDLAAGKSYEELETDYLTQYQAVKNVGDIGWVNIKQVPESFHKPLQTMEVKQVYPETILSEYGVHVLYLEDKRKIKPPEFDDVKAGIKKSLEQKAIERYQQLAQVKAKVVLLK